MSFGPQSFRSSAFALTVIGALAMESIALSVLAAAEQAASKRSAPDCGKVAGTGQKAICGMLKHIDDSNARSAAAERRAAEADKRAAEADKRGTEADKRGTEADKRGTEAGKEIKRAQNRIACMDEVGKRIVAAKKIGPLSPAQKVFFKSQIERCDKS